MAEIPERAARALRVVAVLASIAVPLGFAPSVLAAEETGQIAGTVTSASTHAVIAGIEVCAIAVGDGEAQCGTTESSGEYAVQDLTAGEYKVSFGHEYVHKLNYIPQFYGGKSLSSEAQLVSVVAGSTKFGIDAQLLEGGQISGTVTVPGGLSPYIMDVDVCAYAVNGESDGCGQPNLNGEYTIAGLSSSEYNVSFSSHGFNWLTQYYNGKSSLTEAQLVPVSVGNATSGIDAQLQYGGQITGRVTNIATKTPIENIRVCAKQAGGGESCGWTNASGEYTIAELTTGEYGMTFAPNTSVVDYFFLRGQTVSVTAGAVTSGVDAGLTEGGRITGRVTDASTGEPIEGVEACALEVGVDGVQCGRTNSNGEYGILRLSGEYRVEFRSTLLDNYLAEFYGGEPSLRDAQVVSVTAPGTISGIDVAMEPGIFTEPANTALPVVSGTLAVGDVLSCSLGSWRGDPVPTFTDRWLRDGAPISGATESSYIVQSTDEGHSLSCEVIAVSATGGSYGIGHAVSVSVVIAAGSSTGGSPGGPGTQPPETVTTTGLTAMPPITTTSLLTTPLVILGTSKLVVSESRTPVHVACSEATCQGSIELVVQAASKRHKGKTAVSRGTVVLATGSFTLVESKNSTVVLRLTAAGKNRLAHARHHPVAARLVLAVKGMKTVTKSVLAS